ncbi:NAD(P)-dependent oxidoreductase [Coprobacillaceae bacterium CR2/5/TPMF4]|nr:NAD(P)-dependent oxidoreductase [Coprobacillaceae bacterium CR2/5/TPMF4]
MDCSCLNQYGNAIIYEQTEVDEVSKRIEDASIVITNKHILGPEQLKNATKLKLICVTATGVNNIDLEYCKLANIAVCNVKGYSTNAVAQHTFALLLDLYNKNHYYHNYIASGNYASSSMFTHLGHSFHELDNKVWGIVGMGDIGRKVANLAEAFGCQVQYYSTSGRNNQAQFKRVDFDTLLKTSDIITIHAPLNKQTEYLFDEEVHLRK